MSSACVGAGLSAHFRAARCCRGTFWVMITWIAAKRKGARPRPPKNGGLMQDNMTNPPGRTDPASTTNLCTLARQARARARGASVLGTARNSAGRLLLPLAPPRAPPLGVLAGDPPLDLGMQARPIAGGEQKLKPHEQGRQREGLRGRRGAGAGARARARGWTGVGSEREPPARGACTCWQCCWQYGRVFEQGGKVGHAACVALSPWCGHAPGLGSGSRPQARRGPPSRASTRAHERAPALERALARQP